ncbi:hypothetical protein HWI79_2696 [Cryptosporidium felis]|nr:hypothetical protein HWI79_2696 [Cryptosporidium felis]
MNRLSENDQELKDVFDSLLIEDCIKPLRRVTEKACELQDFADEFGHDLDEKIKNISLALRKSEVQTLKLELRLEKILELVKKEAKKKAREKERAREEESRNKKVVEVIGTEKKKEVVSPDCEEERTMSSSVNSMEQVQVDPMIKRTLNYEMAQRENFRSPNKTQDLSMRVEEDTRDEISVRISTDGSARSLLSKYINGENKDRNTTRQKDPTAKRRQRVDGIKRTVRPLVHKEAEEGKCKGLLKKWCCCCCCLAEKGPTKSGNYFKMSTQEWKDFLASVEPKDKRYKDYCRAVENVNDSQVLEIEGLPPLIVQYASLNAQPGNAGYMGYPGYTGYSGYTGYPGQGGYTGTPGRKEDRGNYYGYNNQLYNAGQYQQYYNQGCYQGYPYGEQYYDARSQNSNCSSYGKFDPKYTLYKPKGPSMQKDVKCMQERQEEKQAGGEREAGRETGWRRERGRKRNRLEERERQEEKGTGREAGRERNWEREAGR